MGSVPVCEGVRRVGLNVSPGFLCNFFGFVVCAKFVVGRPCEFVNYCVCEVCVRVNVVNVVGTCASTTSMFRLFFFP